jgi:hypothetical protein
MAFALSIESIVGMLLLLHFLSPVSCSEKVIVLNLDFELLGEAISLSQHHII